MVIVRGGILGEVSLILSLVVGLIAWGFGSASFKSRGWTVMSVLACAMSLALQVFYLLLCMNLRDLSSVLDIGPAILKAAAILVTVTLAVNGIGWLVRKRRRAANL